jgi:reactive intermediate/imine deaminase
MSKQAIQTEKAPKAIGVYSQAIKTGNTVYLSGQIPLVPATGELVSADIQTQLTQTFENLSAVAVAAGGSLNDIVKLHVYLKNLSDFVFLNEVMARYFAEPYPARLTIGVNELPKNSLVEIDGIMVIS